MGASAGDAVLREVSEEATRVGTTLPTSGALWRGEFLIVAPGCNLTKAAASGRKAAAGHRRRAGGRFLAPDFGDGEHRSFGRDRCRSTGPNPARNR